VELVQSKLPINNILGCKAALICTSLAYTDGHKRLKALVPVREYMQKIQPPGDDLIQPILKYFQQLLELFVEYHGTQSSSGTVARISSNYSNIQKILQNGLQQDHPDLVNNIYCACHLNRFTRSIGHKSIPLFEQIYNILPQPCDHRLEAYFITEMFNSSSYALIVNSEALIAKALQHFKWFEDKHLECMLPD
jgi:hypothetical protein